MTCKVLPPCSTDGCDKAAGAIINGAMYCGTHAVDQLQTRVLQRKGNFQPARS